MMAKFPFEWWYVLIVTLVGTALWLGAVYYAATTTPARAKEGKKGT
jgi:hypothetical protein